jgi:hypothetical protein
VPVCKRTFASAAADAQPILAMADQTRSNAASDWVTLSYWCPQHQDPSTAPTATDIRDQAIRLLPHVPAETTAPNTLVNIQTLLWAATDPHRNLGRIQILGQPVWIHLDFDHADWNFGDGHTDHTTTPGKTYDPTHDRCTTVNCPDYYGHTYRTTGEMTITVTITWHATYSLDGTHYTPVDTTPITGPAATVHIRARQARAQLVDTG